MDRIAVGSKDCSIHSVWSIFSKSESFKGDWANLARHLEIPTRTFQRRLNIETNDENGILMDILQNWVSKLGSNARLVELIQVIEDKCGDTSMGENLRLSFNLPCKNFQQSTNWDSLSIAFQDKVEETISKFFPNTPIDTVKSRLEGDTLLDLMTGKKPKDFNSLITLNPSVDNSTRPLSNGEQRSFPVKADPIGLEKVSKIDKETLDFIKSKTPLDVLIDRPTKPMSETFKDSYGLPTGQKGLALLINIIEFSDENFLKRRTGSENDLVYLTELMMQLGYEIHPQSKHLREKASKTKQEVLDLIQDFKKKCELKEPASIFIFLGSHGFHPNQIATSDSSEEDLVTLELYKDIVSEFYHKSCPVLVGKPKIFLIQACQSILRNEIDAAREHLITDGIICSAQIPGGNAIRDIYKGSWFIYCFTYQMMKNVKHKSFQEIIEDTQVMLEMIEGGGPDCDQQQLYITPMLLKRLYLPIDP